MGAANSATSRTISDGDQSSMTGCSSGSVSCVRRGPKSLVNMWSGRCGAGSASISG